MTLERVLEKFINICFKARNKQHTHGQNVQRYAVAKFFFFNAINAQCDRANEKLRSDQKKLPKKNINEARLEVRLVEKRRAYLFQSSPQHAQSMIR